MLSIDIPGHGLVELEHLVLDVNGTIAFDGGLISGVADAVSTLKKELRVIAVTADTYGQATHLGKSLGAEVRIIERGREAESKLDLVDELGADSVVAIGNGANDALMLKDAAIGIAVVGGEGAARTAVEAADVITWSIEAALGLLLEPKRLIAAMRQ
jgi:P-type E1-E2 ATPase